MQDRGAGAFNADAVDYAGGLLYSTAFKIQKSVP